MNYLVNNWRKDPNLICEPIPKLMQKLVLILLHLLLSSFSLLHDRRVSAPTEPVLCSRLSSHGPHNQAEHHAYLDVLMAHNIAYLDVLMTRKLSPPTLRIWMF